MSRLFGGIEAGGTKFNCVIGSGAGDVRARAQFPTTIPSETMDKVVSFFTEQSQKFGNLDGLSIGSFGPLELNKASDRYGFITSTPKIEWSNFDILGELSRRLNIPSCIETDVNAAAVGEGLHGNAKGLEHFVYVTIGTGIGAGIVVNGQLLNGVSHTEVGHMLLPHFNDKANFKGICPFHHNCLEGVACGPAIKARWGIPAESLPINHEAWAIQAYYLGIMCVNLTLCYAPQRIILGGGVMAQQHLFPMIRQQFKLAMNGYKNCNIMDNLDEYIVLTALNGEAGELGCLELAKRHLGTN